MIGIVGGGLAAAKCVESYREQGGEDEIVVWSQDPHGPYNRPPLSKRLLRGEAEPADALVHPLEWYAEHGVDLRLGESVSSLDEVRADTVVIATGARPRALGDALALRTIDNSLEMRRRAETARTAVVVGGGFIGCEVTASLTLLGVSVTQVVREPMVFAPLQAPPLSAASTRPTARTASTSARGDGDPGRELFGGGHRRRAERRARACRRPRGAERHRRRRTLLDRSPRRLRDRRRRGVLRSVFRRHRRIEHWSNAAYHGTTLGRILAGDDEARYDIVSAFFSEEFGRSFRLFGDPSGTTTAPRRRLREATRCSGSCRAVTRRGGRRRAGRGHRERPQGRDSSRRGGRRLDAKVAETTTRGGADGPVGHRTALDRHDPHALDGRRAAGERRPSRARAMALAPLAYLLYTRGHAAQPREPALAEPRPVRAQRRATPACSSTRRCTCRATTYARRAEAVPAVGLAQRPAIPSSATRRASRRRPARSGRASANGVGHGDRRAVPARDVQPPAPETVDHRIYVICSDGDLMEGVSYEAALDRGPAAARQARLLLRRQPDHDRRDDLDLVLAEDGAKRFEALRLARRSTSRTCNDLDAIARGDRRRAWRRATGRR